MEESKYVDLLIVMCHEQLYVAETTMSTAQVNDLVEFDGMIGHVVDNNMTCRHGDERYEWVSKFRPISKVTQIWRLTNGS